MTFIKGKGGNPEGRPKGSKNKVTEASKGIFLQVMEGELEHIQNSLDLLREESPEKYMRALSGLFPYFMPKQMETLIEISDGLSTPSWFDEVLERTDQKEEHLTKDAKTT